MSKKPSFSDPWSTLFLTVWGSGMFYMGMIHIIQGSFHFGRSGHRRSAIGRLFADIFHLESTQQRHSTLVTPEEYPIFYWACLLGFCGMGLAALGVAAYDVYGALRRRKPRKKYRRK